VIDDVLAQSHQIGDALWRVESAGIAATERSGGLAICGMGGSAVGGDLALAAIGDRATRPIRTVRGYSIEPWTDPDTLVLCASYSGSTEETLSCFGAAGAAGAARVALTTGGELAERARAEGVPVIGVPSGMQPRAAVVYMTVAALECAALAGAAPSLRPEIEATGELLAELDADWAGGGLPVELAERLSGSLVVVHGAGPTAAVARRWKTQLNENAKHAAVFTELPEANHNEIEGWAWAHEHTPAAAVMLDSPDLHPRLERRMDLLTDLIGEIGVPVIRVAARGETPVEHVLSLVHLGDLMTVRIAEADGIDPEPVDAIEGFKRRL
jgi:glucose/mannose-6-phosphate isomerase